MLKQVGFLFAPVAVLALAQPSVPPERALSTYIEAHTSEAEALLEGAVNINSGTHLSTLASQTKRAARLPARLARRENKVRSWRAVIARSIR